MVGSVISATFQPAAESILAKIHDLESAGSIDRIVGAGHWLFYLLQISSGAEQMKLLDLAAAGHRVLQTRSTGSVFPGCRVRLGA